MSNENSKLLFELKRKTKIANDTAV